MKTMQLKRMQPRTPRARQRGAALYVALVFLVLLALIGISGMQVALMQERMSANYRAANIAFQRAEGVARLREAQIEQAFQAGGAYVSDQERCDPAFDPAGWSGSQAALAAPDTKSRVRRIDMCTTGRSLTEGGTINNKTDLMYQVTAFASDTPTDPTSDSAIDTIFIP